MKKVKVIIKIEDNKDIILEGYMLKRENEKDELVELIFQTLFDTDILEQDEEKHICDDCNKTVFGNYNVILMKDNAKYCLSCYHKNHKGEE